MTGPVPPQRLKLIYFGSGVPDGERRVNEFLDAGAEVVEMDFVDNQAGGAPLLKIWFREPNGTPPMKFKLLDFDVRDHHFSLIEETVNGFLAENNAQRVISRMSIMPKSIRKQSDAGNEYDLPVWRVQVLLVFTTPSSRDA